jgi:hypothetical protein
MVSTIRIAPALSDTDRPLRILDENAIAGMGQDLEKDGRLFPSARSLLGIAILGVILALLWRNLDPQLWAERLWSGPIAQPSEVASTPASGDQLGHLERELNALKKNVSELATAQQQIAASIAALQTQQELQRRSSFQASFWYSNPAALMSQIAPAQDGNQKPTVRARPETRDSTAGRHIDGAPLPLVPPRP